MPPHASVSPGYRDAGAPAGRAIELRQPNVLGLLGALTLAAGLVGILVPLVVLGPSPVLAIGLTFLLLGLGLVVAGLVRGGAEYRLVLDARGVFLVHRSGAVEGLLGHGSLALTPGHYVYASRTGALEKQCVAIGHHLSIGTNAIGTVRYRVPVPRMPLPRFYLKAADWDALVQALPALRSIQ
jgi:hypothetical protein